MDTLIQTLLGTAAVGMLGYVFRGLVGGKLAEMKARRQAFESHIALCNQKSTAFALLEQRVCKVEDQVDADRKTREWFGDSIVKIAAKMSVELTERPS